MEKALVIIPTFNERESVPVVIDAVLKHSGFSVLIIDDGSPDGTADVVRKMMESDLRIFLVERASKMGLGSAYVAGFKWGLERDYDRFVEMDADGSHDPDALPLFSAEMEKGYGLLIGSRYLEGTISVIGWDFKRLLLSKFGNFYASRALGMRVTDMTSGFRCYARSALESIDLDEIHSNGYAFQIEMAYRTMTAGFPVGEIPIIFRERTWGDSKMSRKIIREAIVLPWRMRLERLLGSFRGDLGYNIRTIIGFLSVMAGAAGGLRLGWWLSTEGDVVEIIHRAKMGLPDWAWTAMKIGLSAGSAVFFMALLLTVAFVVFSEGRKK